MPQDRYGRLSDALEGCCRPVSIVRDKSAIEVGFSLYRCQANGAMSEEGSVFLELNDCYRIEFYGNPDMVTVLDYWGDSYLQNMCGDFVYEWSLFSFEQKPDDAILLRSIGSEATAGPPFLGLYRELHGALLIMRLYFTSLNVIGSDRQELSVDQLVAACRQLKSG